MSLHLIKLSVGTEDFEDMRRWQAERLRATGRLFHRTRMMPRRREELLSGGSIYWVVRGKVLARQMLAGIEPVVDAEGRPDTHLMLHPHLVPTVPWPHRPFQGWRYLVTGKAPPDLADLPDGARDMPPAMIAELQALGLL
ncbi:MAG: DUF1489 domain-containing protein [Alphaproteobacteria bacterium]|nr:DUF1489 domain-containing protein [Alphaproteobacteria bacterium]